MFKLSVLFQRHFAPTWLINKGSKAEARPCYKPVICAQLLQMQVIQALKTKSSLGYKQFSLVNQEL